MSDDTMFKGMALELAELLEVKGKAYGSSFDDAGKIIAILFPDGVRPDQYTDLLAITRILDKLFRIATDKNALNEEPYKDIAGYGLLGLRRERLLKQS